MDRKLKVLYYGGDYNPEQWDEDVWEEDIKMMKVFKVNVVTLPVFSWAKLQPSENIFNFRLFESNHPNSISNIKIIKLISIIFQIDFYISYICPWGTMFAKF